jgi:hypothetical protein
LEGQARQGINALELPEHQSLQSTLRRGWYWGSEQFREYLLKKVDAAAIRRNRNYQTAQMGRDHGQAEAEKIVQQGLERFRLSERDLKSSPGSDPRKVAIAGFIRQSTTTPQGWTAERLQMKSAANVSQQLSRAKKTAKPKPVREKYLRAENAPPPKANLPRTPRRPPPRRLPPHCPPER